MPQTSQPTRSSLQTTDEAAEAVASEPRVRLADIEAAIAGVYYMTAGEALSAVIAVKAEDLEPLHCLSLCVLVLKNGFTVVGKSAPASPKNFDTALGRQFAYEDAIRQLWPLMGFVLRTRLHEGW